MHILHSYLLCIFGYLSRRGRLPYRSTAEVLDSVFSSFPRRQFLSVPAVLYAPYQRKEWRTTCLFSFFFLAGPTTYGTCDVCICIVFSTVRKNSKTYAYAVPRVLPDSLEFRTHGGVVPVHNISYEVRRTAEDSAIQRTSVKIQTCPQAPLTKAISNSWTLHGLSLTNEMAANMGGRGPHADGKRMAILPYRTPTLLVKPPTCWNEQDGCRLHPVDNTSYHAIWFSFNILRTYV